MAHPEVTPGAGVPSPMSPKLLETVFLGLDVGIYVIDEMMRITAVNPRMEALLQRPAAEFIGADAHDLLHREADGATIPRSKCVLLQAFLSGQTLLRPAGVWFARADGSTIPVGFLTTPYHDPSGEGGGAVVFFAPRADEDGPGTERLDHPTALADLADRLALVAETTTVLTSTLNVDEALRRLVRLVVPRLAEWAVVDLIGDDDELRRVAVVHQEGDSRVNVEELEGPLPPVSRTSRMPLSQVLRGAPARLVEPKDYAVPPDSGVAEVQRELFEATGMHSAVIAPLRGPRGVLGALTVARGDRQRPFDAAELALVEDIARRAGLAVDNARLHEQQRRVAETMQRHLLPPLPRIDGLEMAARYLPAPTGAQVGGDWYDAFVLPDGVTTLVIGDVVGHDLQAAACMSQVRNMLRAFAWERQAPPSLIIDRLDRALVNISDAPMVTLVLARVERPEGGPWQLRWSNAGHPPPLLVDQDGRTRFLEGGHGLLLGTETEVERVDAIAPLPVRTTVVLYTDGLVESPALPLEEGMNRLRRHAASLAHCPLDDFCDELIRRTDPAGTEDDIAVLVLRVPHPSPDRAK